MITGIICAWFGFFCLAGEAPGREIDQAIRGMTVIEGRASVQDGDTIEIAGRTIRLQGIDAPESAQSCEDERGGPWRCGRAAALALDAMLSGKTVECVVDPRDAEDRYGRALAICRVRGQDIGLMLLHLGHAVAYRRYLDWPDRSARGHKAGYIAAEIAARQGRIGIWQGRFDLPETWRAARRARIEARERQDGPE